MIEIIELDVNEILVEDRARIMKDIDVEFLKSVEEKGVIQPVTVMRGEFFGVEVLDQDEADSIQLGSTVERHKTYNYKLVAGERRTIACKLLGKKVPAIVREVADQLDYKEIELFENLHRKALHWPDEARLLRQISELYAQKHGSIQKTADAVGESRANVSKKIDAADMLDIVPGLADCKTQDEAVKLFKKMQNDIVIKDLRVKQEAKIASGNLSRVKAADYHYRIGDALVALEELAISYKEEKRTSLITLFEVDPPYGIDLMEQKSGDDSNRAYDGAEYTEVARDKYTEFLARTCKAIYEVGASDCWVLFWYGWTWHIQVKLALLQAGFKVDDIPAIWVKGTGQTQNPTVLLGRAHEPFFLARKGNPTIKNRGRSNVFDYSPVPPTQKYHPTQRPLEMMMDIVDTFMYPGSIGCIPFLGSGVTLRAFYRLGINGFGWDLSQKHKDEFLLAVEEDFKDEEAAKNAVPVAGFNKVEAANE